MVSFEELLERNNLDNFSFISDDDNTYLIRIPYKDDVMLSLISSFVADLTNNGYDVNSSFENREVIIQATVKESEEEEDEEIEDVETSASYYMVQRWVKQLNNHLQELEVVAEKDNKGEHEYGKNTLLYIMNPEINIDELLYIIDYLDGKNVPLKKEWFTQKKVKLVRFNNYLLEQGYSPNETYLTVYIYKDEINFDPSQNLPEKYQRKVNK